MWGLSKSEKLEKRRQHTLSFIRDQRWRLDAMIERAQVAHDPTNPAQVVAEPKARLTAFESQIATITKIDAFDDIEDEAEEWSTFRAYICPRTEIEAEGNLSVNLLEEWGVPKSSVQWMRESLASRLTTLTDPDVQVARSALKTILAEENSWSEYTNDYEGTMKGYTRRLWIATFVLIAFAIVGLRYRLYALPVIFLGIILFCGAAGSCVSVVSKLPLFDVTLSSELEAYGRRILSRVATGTVASLVGCALFSVLMVSIDKLSFVDIATACASQEISSCTIVKQLALLAIPILFGFSERTLTSVERKVLGEN
jgi:hypothetical protein